MSMASFRAQGTTINQHGILKGNSLQVIPFAIHYAIIVKFVYRIKILKCQRLKSTNLLQSV
jgi:hypothetical protein